MSRAFVKETETVEELPDRLVSEYRNLVTADGLAMLEANVAKLQADLSDAHASGDREAIAHVSRDLRYWSQRLASAEVRDAPQRSDVVTFGSQVTITRADGRRQTYRIVGEDEAEPAKGTISYVSPMAQALMGKSVGEEIRAGQVEAEITKIG